MFNLENILAILDHWPRWKKITQMPDAVEALEIRIATLESRLARCPGEGCPKCGELAFRTVSTKPIPGRLGTMGASLRDMKCGSCGYLETRKN